MLHLNYVNDNVIFQICERHEQISIHLLDNLYGIYLFFFLSFLVW